MIGAGDDGPPAERVIFGVTDALGVRGVIPQRNNVDPAATEWFSPARYKLGSRQRIAALVSESQPDGLDIDGIAMAK